MEEELAFIEPKLLELKDLFLDHILNHDGKYIVRYLVSFLKKYSGLEAQVLD